MTQNLSPRIAALTMSYQENVMLPLWVKHYSHLVGRENLFILDHGNHPPIAMDDIQIIKIDRPNCDDISRLNTIKTWQQNLLKTYDWVIFSDTDEFILFRQPSTPISFQEYLAKQTTQIIRCIGIDVIDPGNLPPIDWTQPILQQRPKGIVSSWSCKSLISAIANDWNPGFHTTNSTTTVDNQFWLFHLKYADETHLMQRLSMTRQFKWSNESLNAGFGGSHRVPDFIMQKHLNNLRAHTAKGTLDDFLATPHNIDHVNSPLMDIPNDFIPLL